jgi:hypothetical protein
MIRNKRDFKRECELEIIFSRIKDKKQQLAYPARAERSFNWTGDLV